ncbi:MAG TPA: tRNA (adenosine(37)-N6)-dimethylallyltransferase MiaA [Chthoniobacterales bacterium]|jgi:tRNA dimethylallyltransferase
MNWFFIVGPTATGKSELAAEIAQRTGAEIISADAFQIYRGLDLLTAKPESAVLAKAPHHLIGALPLSEVMNAEKFRTAAMEAVRDIHARAKLAIIVGGCGLYIKALTHGLSELPAANPKLRAQLEGETTAQLFARLRALDPPSADRIDSKNKHRLLRAVEVCLLSGRPFSVQRIDWNHASPRACTAGITPNGIFIFRERAELYERINRRVEAIFAKGVVDEVRRIGEVGPTAEKALGFREIRSLLAGEISEPVCIARIQQATRRYAKRQLTWFQRQTNFQPLNLSLHGSAEAIESIAQNVARLCANG